MRAILATLSNVERAALHAHWTYWARPEQLAPAGDFRSWGFLGARGMGKTRALVEHVNEEVQAGRARRIGLAAQNETKTIAVQVGSLIDMSPPWFAPRWDGSRLELVWPNGAKALAFTPEVPGSIRSENFDLTWLSELQSWPASTREEAFSNFQFATRVGYARTVWDATPKRRHPLLKKLIARESAAHRIARGTIYDNAANLSPGVIADLEREYAGTIKGREELLGEMLSESESAMVHQEWIDAARRHMPDVLLRRVLGVDPAVTTRAGNDRTGIVETGLGIDRQVYVLADDSGRHAPGAWASIVLERYVRDGCDLIVVETNKGGDLVTQNLRAEAPKRGLQVVVIGRDELSKPRQSGTVFVREVHARGAKEDRAQPLATAYERGRVSHVMGVDLRELEDTLTTWEPIPGQRSPDALDALAHAAGELLGLGDNRQDRKVGFEGVTQIADAISPSRGRVDFGRILGGGGSL